MNPTQTNEQADPSGGKKPSKFSRRKLIIGAAATLGGVGLAGLGSWWWNRSSDRPAMTVTSGYIPIVDCTPIPIAYEKGFFREMGLRAERPTLIRTWDALLEAFASEQILLTHILLFQLIFMRYERNIPVRSIAFNHQNGIAMLGGRDVRSFRDLGGKIVGCPYWWAPHTLLFQECIRHAGLTPVVHTAGSAPAANEVSFRVLPPPDMPNALQTGAIAGAVVSEGFGAAAELLAGCRLLRMSGDVWRNHPCCQSVLLQTTIDRDRSWAQAVTTAIARACAWCEQNREEMIEILAQDGGGYFPMPKRILRRAINHVDLAEYGVETGTGAIRHPDWNVKRLALNPYPYPSAFRLAVQLMRRNVVAETVALTDRLRALEPQQTADEIVEYEFIRQAVTDAGGLNQFDGVDPRNPFERTEQYEI